MYVDNSQRNLIEDITDGDGHTIKDIHVMTYDEAITLNEDTSEKISARETGSTYWLATNYVNGGYMYAVGGTGEVSVGYGNSCVGVRPIVTLKTGVYIKSGDGTEESPYVLGMEQ